MASPPSATAPDSSRRPSSLRWVDQPPQHVDVLVIGGGFSGLLVAIGILERDPHVTVAVVERSPRWAPGVAYGGCEPQHLLNVHADRMGATAEAPGDFHDWLERTFPGAFHGSDFVARSLYGEYLNETVSARLAPHRARVRLVRDSVVELDLHHASGSSGGVACLASGARVGARVVVLAVGLPAAPPTWRDDTCDATPGDPWSEAAFSGLRQEEAIVVVGTGLTALDVLVSLSARSHRGPIAFVSRNGRFPLPHAVSVPPTAQRAVASEVDVAALAEGPRQALRTVRDLARRYAIEGRPWQDAIDGARAHATATWQAWSQGDRERFLARIRPFWEIHRHRAPRNVLHLLDRGLATGRIVVMRGSIAGIAGSDRGTPHGRRLTVVVRPEGTGAAERSVGADRVFHCIGPAMRIREISDPLLRSLLGKGAVSADVAGLGLRADGRGRAMGADGRPNPALLVLGALRRGDLWESTAVPELRLQTDSVSEESVRTVRSHECGNGQRPTPTPRRIHP